MKRIFFILLSLFALAEPIFGQIRNENFEQKLDNLYAYSVPLISVDQLDFELKNKTKIVILDTRQEEEYSVSHIPDARFVDYNKFKVEEVADIPKDAKVVVYCSVGYRSERVGEKLKKAGYEDVYNLYGGIFEWVNQDHEVVDGTDTPTERVHTYNKKWSQWLDKGEKTW